MDFKFDGKTATIKNVKRLKDHDGYNYYTGKLYIDGKPVAEFYEDDWGGDTHWLGINGDDPWKNDTFAWYRDMAQDMLNGYLNDYETLITHMAIAIVEERSYAAKVKKGLVYVKTSDKKGHYWQTKLGPQHNAQAIMAEIERQNPGVIFANKDMDAFLKRMMPDNSALHKNNYERPVIVGTLTETPAPTAKKSIKSKITPYKK